MTSATLFAASPKPEEAVPCADRDWFAKHNYLVGQVTQASRNPRLDIYVLGDSITEFWPQMGKDSWQAEFGKLRVLNCGVSGDTTQNILFRITHGELERISPKVVVVLAGTNNIGRSPELLPQELARGVHRIVATIRAKTPASKILLLSIFPSGGSDDVSRQRILATNSLLAASADKTSVFYLDIYNAFLAPDGSFLPAVTPDGTHLNAKGYQIWADAMRPTIEALLKTFDQ